MCVLKILSPYLWLIFPFLRYCPLLNFLIHAIIMTVVFMPLTANSVICVHPWLVLIDFFPYFVSFFLPLHVPDDLNWITDFVNITLLVAKYF